MIPDKVNPSFIPNDLLQSWAQMAQADLNDLLQIPGITLGHMEERLEAQARKLMLPILRAAAQEKAAQQPFQCPICGGALLAEAHQRSRTLDTVFGSFALKRDYGWCPTCARYWHPADPALGLAPQAPASPRMQEIAALMSLRNPYAQAAKDAHRLTGLPLNPASLHREAKRQGQRATQCRQPLLRFLDRRNEGALDVLHELEDLRQRLKNLSAFQEEALGKEIGYFTTHHKRMDYKQAKAQGEPVGSGVVESTGRQYQTRFKCTGQFWTLEGDESLLALSTLYRNERWDLLFPHARPTANQKLRDVFSLISWNTTPLSQGGSTKVRCALRECCVVNALALQPVGCDTRQVYE